MKLEDSMEIACREYLLGQLSESDEKRFEQRLMDDDELFSRAEALIECIEDDLVEDYLRGELKNSEQSAFEQRFLGSPKIQGKLTLVQALIKKSNAQQMVAPTNLAEKQRNLFRVQWWRRTILQPLPALAASLLLFVLGGGFWSATRIWRLEDRLSEMQTRQLILVSSQEKLGLQLAEERQLTRQLTAELDSAAARSANLEQSIRALGQRTMSSVASFMLAPGLSRGSGRVATVQLSQKQQLFELRLDLGLDEYPAYRAAVCNAGGEEILVHSRLSSTRIGDQVLVVFHVPSELLQPGQYLVKLFGITSAGNREQLELYHFRLVRE